MLLQFTVRDKITVYKDKRHLISTFVSKSDEVLDIGFMGHDDGVESTHSNWAHTILRECAGVVYGLDLDFDASKLTHPEHYLKGSAEDFNFSRSFDVVFAGDIIEHLSNPGLFLSAAKRHLKPGGRLILTTPNTFNLYNIAGKVANLEPAVHPQHTMYFNLRTLRNLLKHEWTFLARGYVYRLDMKHKESWKKKVLNVLYRVVCAVTPKYMENIFMVVSARS